MRIGVLPLVSCVRKKRKEKVEYVQNGMGFHLGLQTNIREGEVGSSLEANMTRHGPGCFCKVCIHLSYQRVSLLHGKQKGKQRIK
jgi:hypothetical protein